jgi:hypothetical protein
MKMNENVMKYPIQNILNYTCFNLENIKNSYHSIKVSTFQYETTFILRTALSGHMVRLTGSGTEIVDKITFKFTHDYRIHLIHMHNSIYR